MGIIMSTTLETLVVKLVGDGASYQKMLEQAQRQTKAAMDSLDRHIAKVNKSVEISSRRHVEGIANTQKKLEKAQKELAANPSSEKAAAKVERLTEQLTGRQNRYNDMRERAEQSIANKQEATAKRVAEVQKQFSSNAVAAREAEVKKLIEQTNNYAKESRRIAETDNAKRAEAQKKSDQAKAADLDKRYAEAEAARKKAVEDNRKTLEKQLANADKLARKDAEARKKESAELDKTRAKNIEKSMKENDKILANKKAAAEKLAKQMDRQDEKNRKSVERERKAQEKAVAAYDKKMMKAAAADDKQIKKQLADANKLAKAGSVVKSDRPSIFSGIPTAIGSAISGIASKSFMELPSTDLFRNMGAAAAESFQMIQDGLMKISASLIQMGTISVKEFAEFELSMTHLIGLVGISKDQVASWSSSLINMGTALGKTPNELAKGMYYITSGGLRGAKAMEALTDVSKASAAGLGEVATVANVVKSAMNAYHDSGLTSAKATDILVATVREGKLEINSLGGSIARLIPMASAMGVQFEDVMGVVAAMSRVGATAAESGFSIQSFLMNLRSPSKDAIEVLNSVGIRFKDLLNVLKRPGGLIDVWRILERKFGGDELAFNKVVPNVRAIRGALNILSQDADIVNGVMEGVRNSTGATDYAFKHTSETLDFKYRQAVSSVNAGLIVLGETLKSTLAPALDLFNSLATKTIEIFSKNKVIADITTLAATLMAVVGPAVLLVITIKKFGLSLMIAFGPAVALMSGVAAAAAILVLEFGRLDDIWKALKDNSGDIFSSLKTSFSNAINYISSTLEPFQDAFKYAWRFITDTAIVAGVVLVTAFKTVQSAISGIINFIFVAGKDNKGGQSLFDKFVDWANYGYELAVSLSGTAIGITGVVMAVYAATYAISGLLTVFGFFKAMQVASIVLWGVWTAAVVTANVALLAIKATVFVMSGVMAAFNAVMSLASMVGWIAMIPIVAAGIVMVSVASATLLGIFYGLYEAAFSVVKAFKEFPHTASAIEYIGSLFAYWYKLLSDVVSLITSDLPSAWALLKASIRIAVSQMTDLWPPVWKFISAGFTALWELVTSQFEVAFYQTFHNVIANIASVLDPFGLFTSHIEASKDAMNAWAKTASNANKTAAALAMELATMQFRLPGDSDATKEAKKNLEDVKWLIAESGTVFDDSLLPDENKKKDNKKKLDAYGHELGGALGKGAKKELEKIEAALFGSAESITRLQNYAAKGATPAKGQLDHALGQADLLKDKLEDAMNVLKKKKIKVEFVPVMPYEEAIQDSHVFEYKRYLAKQEVNAYAPFNQDSHVQEYIDKAAADLVELENQLLELGLTASNTTTSIDTFSGVVGNEVGTVLAASVKEADAVVKSTGAGKLGFMAKAMKQVMGVGPHFGYDDKANMQFATSGPPKPRFDSYVDAGGSKGSPEQNSMDIKDIGMKALQLLNALNFQMDKANKKNNVVIGKADLGGS